MSYRITRDKFLTAEELTRLLGTLGSDRNSLIIKLALATGARASELLALTAASLSKEGGVCYIHIKGIKGSDDRTLPIKPELHKALLAEASGDALFAISYPRLVQIWNFYRPKGKTFHSLRHTFAVGLYERSKDIKLVQVALGHRNINNTLVYAQLVDSQAKLRRALLGA